MCENGDSEPAIHVYQRTVEIPSHYPGKDRNGGSNSGSHRYNTEIMDSKNIIQFISRILRGLWQKIVRFILRYR